VSIRAVNSCTDVVVMSAAGKLFPRNTEHTAIPYIDVIENDDDQTLSVPLTRSVNNGSSLVRVRQARNISPAVYVLWSADIRTSLARVWVYWK